MAILVKIIRIAISLPFMFLIPGFALLNSRSSVAVNLDNIERYGLMVTVSAATTSVFGLLLTEFGYLRLWILIPLLFITSLGFWRLGKYKARLYEKKRQEWLQLLIMALLVVLSGLLFLQTGEWMTGADPGLYFNMGNVVGKNGSIVIKDTRLAELAPEEHATLAPGNHVFNAWHQINKSGNVRPIFYRMLPTWMGIFIKLFGTKGAFCVNSIFAMMSVLLLYLIGRSLGGTFAGLVAAVLMCFTSLEIYFARIPVAEIIEQFFALAALFVLILYFQHRNRVYPLIFGIILLGLFTSRIEGLIFIVAVLATFCVSMVAGRFDNRDRWMLNSAFAAALIALIYAQTLVQPYFNSKILEAFHGLRIYRFISARIEPAFLGMGVIVVIALVFNLKRFARELAKLGKYASGLLRSCHSISFAWWRALASLLSGLLLLFLYLRFAVRPNFSGSRPNFVRFTWMMGGLYIFIAVVGLCVLIYMSKPETSAYLFTVTMLGSILFFILQCDNGFVPWSLRRNLSNVMPLLLLGVGCLAGLFWYMKHHWWKIAAVGLSVVLLVSFIPMDRLVLSDTAFANVKAEIDYIASITPDCMIISPDHVTANMFGVILRYGYGKNCYWIQTRMDPKQLRDMVEKRRAKGKQVVFMVLPGNSAAYAYIPWLKLVYTGAKFGFSWRALKEFKYRAPNKWVGGTWTPGSKGGMPVEFYDVLPSSPIDEEQTRSITLNTRDFSAGYAKNLVDRVWVRGQPSNASDKALTAVKLPLKRSVGAIKVSITAQLANPGVSDMLIRVNGKLVPAVKTVKAKNAFFSFVIDPQDQQPDFQELLLRAPPLGPKTSSSGIWLLEVEASFL